GDVGVPGGTSLTVTGGLTLNGTAAVGSGSVFVGLQFAASEMCGGVGAMVVNFNSDGRNALALTQANTTLTIGPGITVRGGYGTVGQSSPRGHTSDSVIN